MDLYSSNEMFLFEQVKMISVVWIEVLSSAFWLDGVRGNLLLKGLYRISSHLIEPGI